MSRTRNNDINHIYFPYPKFSIKLKVDLIKLSIQEEDTVKYTLDDILIAHGFRVPSDVILPNGSYRKKRSYIADFTDVKVDIFHSLKTSSILYPPLLITIHDPNRSFVTLFDAILRYHNIRAKTSALELTCDCFTEDRVALYDYLRSHLFLKGQRTRSGQCEGTYYTNNLRRSTKGTRLYLRTLADGTKSVRLELLLKRPILRKLGLEFPLTSLTSLDISTFMDFRYLDTEALRDYLIGKNKEQIRAGNERRPGYGDLVIRVIDSWLSNWEAEDSLMKRVERLKSKTKGVDNYTRFLHPLTEFNEAFMGAVSVQDFLY